MQYIRGLIGRWASLLETPRTLHDNTFSYKLFTNMCSRECKGDQYRGCGHYVVSYYTGETYDCGRPDCKLSSSHMHKTAKVCSCNTTWREQRKVQNLFQFKCDGCKAEEEAARSAEFDRRTRRNW